MNGHVHHDLEELFESLVAGKLPRNLSWSSAVGLIGQIGVVQAHGNDEFAFVVGSQRAFFKRPSTHDLDLEEISRLRRFLRESSVGAEPTKLYENGRVVVVIDHHAAHIYRDLGGSKLDGEITVEPNDPFGFHHHLIHRKEAHYKGDRVPEDQSYYEEIAVDLVHARTIILVGHGTGKSSAVEFLQDYLKRNHPDTYKRIIATEMTDTSSLTDAEAEEIARKHFRAEAESASLQDAVSR